ncbi:MAG TPA: amino acid adenylation domain-containing protein, partial [Thermoanaerobaculia bacterium]|nr:amino acid adenylation domain-containing protein [Thermoanaerobaculia bacterium]
MRERPAARLAGEEAACPFDLGRGPVWRAALLRLAKERHVLLLTLHHIAADGWSMGVLVSELVELYGAAVAGRPARLPELPVQYADYAIWQQGWLQGEVLARQLAYWKRQLAGAPEVLDLPTDRPRPAVQTFVGASLAFTLPDELAEGLEALSRRSGATLFMALLAGFQALLGRYSGQEDIVVGTPVAGRNHELTEGLIGFFVNTLAIRTLLTGDPELLELLARVREGTLSAFAHQDLPFEKLVGELRLERHLSHAPLFQIAFALQNAPVAPLVMPDLDVVPMAVDSGTAKLDLTAMVVPVGGGLTGTLEYNRDLFDRATIQHLAMHFQALLAAAVAEPRTRLAELPLLAAAERHQLLVEWNDTAAADIDLAPALPSLFAAQVARTPDALAVVCGSEVLTYAELDHRASRLAYHLRGRGVGPESRVALLLDRSLARVTATLAILQAGACYVPLDPSYPAERLAFLLCDSAAAVVLTESGLLATLPPTGTLVLCLNRDEIAMTWAEMMWEEDGWEPLPAVGPEALAYVMYTSGSTGTPKGVAVTHRGVVRLVRETGYAPVPGEVFLQLAPYAFDASTFELWGALLHGGRLVMPPPGTFSLAELGDLLARHGVTTLWLTAGLFHQMVDENLAGLAGVRQLLAGGDVLSVPHVLRAVEGLPGTRLINGYGPTEGTTFSCCFPVGGAEEVGSSVPLGRPIAGTLAYVVDRELAPVPAGVAGELLVGGAGLARGYLDRPGLTAERFVPSSFGEVAGERLYRTGDRVRRRADGRIEFLGRLDSQVKIRGFRVEPGEIEAALAAEPGVGEAVVIVREDTSGDRRLVAYVVDGPEGPSSAGALREALKRKLPEPLVPSAIVVLAALPLTAHGKVDRRALPAPEETGSEAESYVAPRGPVERALAEIWSEVLRRERVGVEDDFFVLGGHSLLATQVTSRVQRTLGVDLSLRTLFACPTIASLAVEIERLLDQKYIAIPALASRPLPFPVTGVPLSFAQQRLWFLDRLQPGSSVYNIPLPVRITGRLCASTLGRCLAEIERRHEALRSVFVLGEDGTPVQVVRPPVFTLPLVDLTGLGPAAAESLALGPSGLMNDDGGRPFDLEHGPLWRGLLLRLGREDHLLLLSLHHIVGDGWSMGILMGEVQVLYPSFSSGRPSPLPDLPLQYADFSAWQRGWFQGEVLERQLAYWKRQLAGAPEVLDLPTDRPRPAVQTFAGASLAFTLPEDLARGLEALSRRSGATLFMALLAAFQALLGRYSGQEDVVVGTPVAGRNHVLTEGLIGFFVNSLAMRTRLAGDPEFLELLARVREGTLSAFAHQDLPFEKLVGELQMERGLSHAPLFQVAFVVQNTPFVPYALPELELAPVAIDNGTAKFDLTAVT